MAAVMAISARSLIVPHGWPLLEEEADGDERHHAGRAGHARPHHCSPNVRVHGGIVAALGVRTLPRSCETAIGPILLGLLLVSCGTPTGSIFAGSHPVSGRGALDCGQPIGPAHRGASGR